MAAVVATLGLTSAACGRDAPDVARKTIGARGGLITSADERLTIVFQPGSLPGDTEILIFPSQRPPPIFGAAYRVQPDIDLRVAAEVTYKRPLPPEEPRAAAVAAIRTGDFISGMGFWQPLPRLLIDLEAESVTAKDSELSLYYGMFDFTTVDGTNTAGACSRMLADCFTGASFFTGAGPRDVCFADFDLNGVVDVATADGAADTVSILLGSTPGLVSAATPINVGAGPSALACGDVNGDTAPDFVVTLAGNSTAQLGVGGGGLNFLLAEPTVVAASPVDVALGDMNADGLLDAPVVGGMGAATPLAFGATGTFIAAPEVTTAPFVALPAGIALGHVNGAQDSNLDVVVFGGGAVSAAPGRGDGTFGPFAAMTTVAVGSDLRGGVVADVTGDAIDDLIVADAAQGGVHILESAGDAVNFMPVFVATGAGAMAVAVGDFDGNGFAGDIAVANAIDGTVSVLFRTGSGFVTGGALISGAGATAVTARDINNDGLDDFAVANESDDSVTVFISHAP